MLRIENLSFTYPDSLKPALLIDHLHIPRGSFTLVSGRSGSGKSTLLRLTNALVPYFSGGKVSGSILVDGINPLEYGPQVMSSHVGFVFQEPENQFVVERVEDEIAFSMENAAIPRDEMQIRVGNILRLLDIEPLRYRKVNTLSGGEMQRVAIAAALVLQPKLLVLDEPTSQLDPQAAQDVLTLLDQIRKEQGITILVAEHRLERVLQFCTHMLHLTAGKAITSCGTPSEIVALCELQPPVVRLAQLRNWQPLPLSVEAAIPFAKKENFRSIQTETVKKSSKDEQSNQPVFSVRNLSIAYGTQPVLEDISFDLHRAERLVIMGPNGAGKSTLLRALIGLIKPNQGEILLNSEPIVQMHSAEICRSVGFLPQDPNALLFSETVTQELETSLRNHQLPMDGNAIQEMLDQLMLKEEGPTYPRDLSTGERQRVALGAMSITKPQVLILDEPTRGLDQLAKNSLLALLKEWNTKGVTILMVTHDVELAASFASRVILLEEGHLIADGDPRKILHQFPRYRTQIAQLFPHSGLLTVEDLELSQ